jgi:hypothetical protein
VRNSRAPSPRLLRETSQLKTKTSQTASTLAHAQVFGTPRGDVPLWTIGALSARFAVLLESMSGFKGALPQVGDLFSRYVPKSTKKCLLFSELSSNVKLQKIGKVSSFSNRKVSANIA